MGALVGHLRMFNYAIVTVGKFIDVQNGGRERHRNLRRRTPGGEHAEIPLAVPREGRREEWDGGVIAVLLVRAGQMYVILFASQRILRIRTRTVLWNAQVLVELERNADRLLHLVDPRRPVVVLARHSLAVHVGREVTVHLPPREFVPPLSSCDIIAWMSDSSNGTKSGFHFDAALVPGYAKLKDVLSTAGDEGESHVDRSYSAYCLTMSLRMASSRASINGSEASTAVG